MKSYLRLFFLCSLVIVYVFPARSQNGSQAAKDSLRNLISQSKGIEKLKAFQLLKNIYFAECVDDQTFEAFMNVQNEYEKEAIKQKDLKVQGEIKSNTISALFNISKDEEIIRLAPEYLAFLSKHQLWSYYYKVYQSLLEVYIYNNQAGKAISESKKIYAEAKAEGNKEGLSLASFVMGTAYQFQNRHKESELHYKECIKIAKDNPEQYLMLMDAYYGLCEVLSEQKRSSEALLVLKTWGDELHKHRENPLKYGSITRGKYYLLYTRVLVEMGEFEKAEIYCDSTDNTLNHERMKINTCFYRAQIEESRGNYDKALTLINTSLGYYNEYSTFLSDLLWVKARILSKIEPKSEAFHTGREAALITDSLRNTQFNAQLDELRTVYEVDKLSAEKERTRQRLIAVAAVSALLLFIVVAYVLYSRRLKRKNEALFQQIQEISQKEKAVERCLLSRPEESLTKEMQLFQRLSKYMQSEKAFTNPELNRKKLADHIGTNEVYLADAIREGTGETFSAYLSNLRLLHALEVLEKDANISFDALAIDSGHGSYSAFYRTFTKKYGITPSEYRKFILSGEKENTNNE